MGSKLYFKYILGPILATILNAESQRLYYNANTIKIKLVENSIFIDPKA